MKKLLIVAGALVIVIAGVLVIGVLDSLDHQKRDEKIYLKNINKLNTSRPDGPEKSVFRDVLMTMNPKTGKIPTENIRQFIQKQAIQSRTARISEEEERDFQWTQISTNAAGRSRAIMIDPNNPKKLWLGAATGGLWYNSDFRNNAKWVPVSDNWETLSISSITYDPNDSNTFYVGTGESFTSVNIYRESTSSGVGIYKTTDGGTSWSLLPSTLEFQYVNDIVVRDEEGQSVIYAGVASGIYQGNTFASSPSDGLFRSANGGSSWVQVLPDIEGSSVPYTVSDIELDPSGNLYVGTMRNIALEGSGIILYSENGTDWEVEDRHASWVKAMGGIPGRVLLTSAESMVYAVATGGIQNSFNHIRDLQRYTKIMFKDGASDWKDLSSPSSFWTNIPWHALAIGVDPNDDGHLVVGAFHVSALSNTREVGPLVNWARVSDGTGPYYLSDYTSTKEDSEESRLFVDSIQNHYVHPDVHSLLFARSSNELVVSTDGGVQYTSDMSKAFVTLGGLEGTRLSSYPTFRTINNSLATTQYYTVALHPDRGNMEVLAGTQDNGSFTSETDSITEKSIIGLGDGAYCFFDSDDPLRITSSQQGNYSFWIEGKGHYISLNKGTFINPADYDDRSNLIYSNIAVDGGFQVLAYWLEGRFLDSLAILNVNYFLDKDDLGLDTITYVRLGTNSTTSFSVVKVSPHSSKLDASVILGNQLGDVFKITGLPYNPVSSKIDNDQLPVGYISSIDIGNNENTILVTFSNYGVESVWYTKNGGEDWQNLERNLPNIPIRYGIFNPLDDHKIMLATEMGVWGIEDISDETAKWGAYNEGLPNVRVDMIKARGSDSVIVAATHGRGLFLGKFNQGSLTERVLTVKHSPSSGLIYPNPTYGEVNFSSNVSDIEIFSIDGQRVYSFQYHNNTLNISTLKSGIYFIRVLNEEGRRESYKIVRK